MANIKFQINTNYLFVFEIGNLRLEIPRVSETGFTLIELLIVVAIIGILSALLMTNFIGIRQRARDAQRKADIRQIQSALELYRADMGSYPSAGGSNALNASPCPTPWAFTNSGTTYMAQVPCDPLGTSGVYNNGNYYYKTTTSGYEIGACLENSADTDAYAGSFDGADNVTCTAQKYFVKTNP